MGVFSRVNVVCVLVLVMGLVVTEGTVLSVCARTCDKFLVAAVHLLLGIQYVR